MLSFSGEETFDASAERVFAHVTDIRLLADSIPDLVSHEIVDELHLKCVVRPGFSFLRMKMKIDIEVQKDDAQRKAEMHVNARGIGASLAITSRLQIVERPPGARLIWSADVTQMTGLVSTVSSDLVRGAADKVIRDNWARLRNRLQG